MDTPPPVPVIVSAPSGNDRLWSVFCHLSALLGVGFVFPLVVYLVMKDESPFVRAHAAEALNFHLSLLIYSLCCVPLVFVFVGVPLLFALGIAALVFSIVAAMKTSDGVVYRYPLSIRFVT